MTSAMTIDTLDLRRTFGCFATGVTVVTAADGDNVHGMTANSFTSVSLDPPLVLICVDNRARMASVLNNAGHFGLNILSSDQEALSRHFSSRNSTLQVDFHWHDHVPMIAGALGQIVCRIVDTHVVGDHSLIIGEVQHHARIEGQPLLYFAGGYQRLQN